MNPGLGFSSVLGSSSIFRKVSNYGSTSTTSFSSHFFLCFGGRFLLYSITRVFDGAMPDCHATRRASVPLLNFFLRVFLICAACALTYLIFPLHSLPFD